ncbi:MAG TPA: histidine kinase [Casimicrobiaceae bacterium]|nr:histidine kinase [Casimicrobiaceae bacterium]
MATLAPPQPLLRSLTAGFHANWQSYALIAAINTGIALVLWTDDVRPFWHPLVTVQIYGFCIAFCVNASAPWDRTSPILRLVGACALGAVIGVILVIIVKDYSIDYVRARLMFFWSNLFAAWVMGLLVSLMFYVKARETRAAAVLMKAEAERHLLSKQAIEAELKLMQAQVEPHFLFNTLASVQFLTETDPPKASQLLAHLTDYLRAALPQLRASSTTLGKEADLAEAYLSILKMRIGPRLKFSMEIPPQLRTHPFPPNLLISIVENAIKHGIEPAADGGTVTVSARHDDDSVIIAVVDTGRGLTSDGRTAGQGVGLSNVRERLAALYGPRARFALEPVAPRGARAELRLPYQAPMV